MRNKDGVRVGHRNLEIPTCRYKHLAIHLTIQPAIQPVSGPSIHPAIQTASYPDRQTDKDKAQWIFILLPPHHSHYPPSDLSLPTRSRNLQELSVLMSFQVAMSFSLSHAPAACHSESSVFTCNLKQQLQVCVGVEHGVTINDVIFHMESYVVICEVVWVVASNAVWCCLMLWDPLWRMWQYLLDNSLNHVSYCNPWPFPVNDLSSSRIMCYLMPQSSSILFDFPFSSL